MFTAGFQVNNLHISKTAQIAVNQAVCKTQSLSLERATTSVNAKRVVSVKVADQSEEKGTKFNSVNEAGEISLQNDCKENEYEVLLTKPLGVRFARGNDGRTYVASVNAEIGEIDEKIKVGDKIIQVSASFGAEIWDAGNFGQIMYAIRTRLGQVYMKLESRGGDTTIFESKELTIEAQSLSERNAGNVGAATRELQTMNYIKKQEFNRKRQELFDDGLNKFYSQDYKGALELFEEIIQSEPIEYLSARVPRFTIFYRSSQYNAACCYASLGDIDAGLEAIGQSLLAGYTKFEKVRKDPNLAPLRKDPRFDEILYEYDPPVINPKAVKAMKNAFGFLFKKDE